MPGLISILNFCSGKGTVFNGFHEGSGLFLTDTELPVFRFLGYLEEKSLAFFHYSRNRLPLHHKS
jgi:hypothetical protein